MTPEDFRQVDADVCNLIKMSDEIMLKLNPSLDSPFTCAECCQRKCNCRFDQPNANTIVLRIFEDVQIKTLKHFFKSYCKSCKGASRHGAYPHRY